MVYEPQAPDLCQMNLHIDMNTYNHTRVAIIEMTWPEGYLVEVMWEGILLCFAVNFGSGGNIVFCGKVFLDQFLNNLTYPNMYMS